MVADLTWLLQKTASNAGVRGGRLSAVERSPNCWPRGAAFLVPRLSAVACPVMEREPEVANCLRLFNRSYTPLTPKASLRLSTCGHLTTHRIDADAEESAAPHQRCDGMPRYRTAILDRLRCDPAHLEDWATTTENGACR
jgi:hypothetical protein